MGGRAAGDNWGNVCLLREKLIELTSLASGKAKHTTELEDEESVQFNTQQGSKVRTKLLPSLLTTVFIVAVSSAHASTEALAQANNALQAGQADTALALLQPQPSSAQVHNLRCRVFFTLEQWDAAASECQQAVNLEEHDSDFHLWLGRALGEKADHAWFGSAFSLAKRARMEFEEAVRLNSQNAAALADLGEFYYEAPAVVGGGAEKADEVAFQLDRVDPERAHELRGRIAESRKDYATAERELKQALAVSKHPAFRWMTLASFYSRRERWDDMNIALKTGRKAAQSDPQSAVALYNGASMLAKFKIDLSLAAQMFRDYLASSSKNEDAPAFVANTRLALVEMSLGDPAAAQRERAAALALAHNYRPAVDLRF
jgi:tetratricopeptide (TPR) repeat protein